MLFAIFMLILSQDTEFSRGNMTCDDSQGNYALRILVFSRLFKGKPLGSSITFKSVKGSRDKKIWELLV